MTIYQITSDHLSIETVKEIISTKAKIELSESAKAKIKKCRDYLNSDHITKEVHYGINTGFGSLCNTLIKDENLSKLQRNLVISHACGIGKEVPVEIVKLMILLKIQGVSYGHSGVQLETVQRLVDFYNNDIIPVVYQQGSLGASGDLAPLAHMSIPLIGEGEVYVDGQKMQSAKMLSKMGWNPI